MGSKHANSLNQSGSVLNPGSVSICSVSQANRGPCIPGCCSIYGAAVPPHQQHMPLPKQQQMPLPKQPQ
eukprot:1136386-Pelagomonas_calceolata.AAC.4